MKKETKAIHTAYQENDPYGALAMPVYHCAAYEFPNAAEMIESFCNRSNKPDYSRVTNPTVIYFENKVKALTEADNVIAFSSGMAAISNALICLSAAGKNIVSSQHMFGNTYAFLNSTLARFNVETKLCDLTNIDEVEKNVDENTCCIYLEIVTNPQLEVADLGQLAAVAKRFNIPLVADTTAIPFTEFEAKKLGVDIEIVSSTKYLSGGGTSIGGLVIDYGTCPGFGKRMKQEMLLNLGAYMTPHVAYMQTLGLETLDARYRMQAGNALELATRLRTVPEICHVNYIGLPDNPYYELSQRQFGPTGGAMLTIELADKESCFSFINRLKLVKRATNLFDNRTLAIHPASTIFGNFTESQLQDMDVSDRIIRISVGLEAVDDIFEDIQQAVKK
ncbi:MAG: PLP-dependent transferase [Coprobacter sp.]|nr:PLP-dependent transferase [Coprobacter sp.]